MLFFSSREFGFWHENLACSWGIANNHEQFFNSFEFRLGVEFELSICLSCISGFVFSFVPFFYLFIYFAFATNTDCLLFPIMIFDSALAEIIFLCTRNSDYFEIIQFPFPSNRINVLRRGSNTSGHLYFLLDY